VSLELEVCENWKKDKIENIHDEYDERDIFNADETGLANKALPDKTFAFKDTLCTYLLVRVALICTIIEVWHDLK